MEDPSWLICINTFVECFRGKPQEAGDGNRSGSAPLPACETRDMSVMKSLNQVSGAHWLCGVCIETNHLMCFLPCGEGTCFPLSAESNANPIQKHPHRHAQKNEEPNIPEPLPIRLKHPSGTRGALVHTPPTPAM